MSENLPSVISPDGDRSIPAYSTLSRSLQSIDWLGDQIHRSGMFGVSKMGAGQLLALEMLATGTRPLDFLRKYHVIEGRPTMKAETMRALFMQDGGDFDVLQLDREVCRVKWTWDGPRGPKEATIEFTADDARAAGKLPGKAGSNWETYRSEMLLARNTTRFMRAYRPDLTSGLYGPDEVLEGGVVPVASIPAEPEYRQAVKPAQREPSFVSTDYGEDEDGIDAAADDEVVDAEFGPSTVGEPANPPDGEDSDAFQQAGNELVDAYEEQVVNRVPISAETRASLVGLFKTHGLTPDVVRPKLIEAVGVDSIDKLLEPQAARLLEDWQQQLEAKAAAG